MSGRTKAVAFILLFVVVASVSFGAGYSFRSGLGAGSNSGLATIEQAWNIIYRDYVDRDSLSPDKLSQGAIEGMINAINDPHTSYLDPDIYRMNMGSFTGNIEGIGARVSIKNSKPVIISVVTDSPADKTGVRAGDVVLEIDGVPTDGMNLTETVLRVRGPRGTKVALNILHEGEDTPVTLEITREEIKLPSVYAEMKEDISYISIGQFSETTDEDLLPVIESLSGQNARGIILDLRSNPGGLLDTVINFASYFLKPETVVVSVVDNQGQETTSFTHNTGTLTELPMVVLVNGYSASGSEVLAGAFQDHDRAVIAGGTTFGKGSVNLLKPLNDGSAIYITTARWFTPDGRPIEGKGIEPDYEMDTHGDAIIQWAVDYLKAKA